MRIYYAHHLWKYGNKIEDYEMRCIHECFDSEDEQVEIVNPKDDVKQENNEIDTMANCYNVIDTCDTLVFSTFSGMVGHGVFNEIIYAFNTGKKVYQLYGTYCYEIDDLKDFIENYFVTFIFKGDNREYALIDPYDY